MIPDYAGPKYYNFKTPPQEENDTTVIIDTSH